MNPSDPFITVDLGRDFFIDGVTLWHSGGLGSDGTLHAPGTVGSRRYMDPRVAISTSGQFSGEEIIVS